MKIGFIFFIFIIFGRFCVGCPSQSFRTSAYNNITYLFERFSIDYANEDCSFEVIIDQPVHYFNVYYEKYNSNVSIASEGNIEALQSLSLRFKGLSSLIISDVTLVGGRLRLSDVSLSKLVRFGMNSSPVRAVEASNSAITGSGCFFFNNTVGAIGSNSNVAFENSSFIQNSAATEGTAIVTTGLIELNNCTFERNSGRNTIRSGSLKLFNSNFVNNTGILGTVRVSLSMNVSGTSFRNNSASMGGGIYFESTSTLYSSVSSSSFVQNMVTISGGGILSNSSSILEIFNCTFLQNFIQSYVTEGGGAIHAIRPIQVSNSTFKFNQALSGNNRGGAILSSDTISLSGNDFISNSAHQEGGAIWSLNEIQSLEDTFISNIAGSGGALYSYLDQVNATKSNFISNNAATGDGGAFWSYYGYIIQCRFEYNYAKGSGGAIVSESNIEVRDSNFTSNTAESDASGLLTSGSITMSTSTFTSNMGRALVLKGGGWVYGSTFTSNSGGAVWIENAPVRLENYVGGGNEFNAFTYNPNVSAIVAVSTRLEMVKPTLNCDRMYSEDINIDGSISPKITSRGSFGQPFIQLLQYPTDLSTEGGTVDLSRVNLTDVEGFSSNQCRVTSPTSVSCDGVPPGTGRRSISQMGDICFYGFNFNYGPPMIQTAYLLGRSDPYLNVSIAGINFGRNSSILNVTLGGIPCLSAQIIRNSTRVLALCSPSQSDKLVVSVGEVMSSSFALTIDETTTTTRTATPSSTQDSAISQCSKQLGINGTYSISRNQTDQLMEQFTENCTVVGNALNDIVTKLLTNDSSKLEYTSPKISFVAVDCQSFLSSLTQLDVMTLMIDSNNGSCSIPSRVLSSFKDNPPAFVLFSSLRMVHDQFFSQNNDIVFTSEIFGLSLLDKGGHEIRVSNTSDAIKLRIPVDPNVTDPLFCFFWDEENGVWSTKGVNTTRDEQSGFINCRTSHLTNFTTGYLSSILRTRQDDSVLNNDSTTPLGLIIGVTIGGLLLIIILIIAFILLRKRLQEQKITNYDMELHVGLKMDNHLSSQIAIQKMIGQGAFASVWLGIHNGTTEVAIKKLINREDTKSFVREANIMKSLHHPNIVQYFGIFQDQNDNSLCMMLEYMPQGDLLNHIRSDTLLPKTRLKIMRDLVSAMCYLEELRVFHCDISARNVLMVGETAKLADFGMSREDKVFTSLVEDKKSIRWSPPEVFNHHQYSTSSDIWMFGVLMWEMENEGKIPYGDKDNAQVMRFVSEGGRLTFGECDKELKEAIEKCWKSDPKERGTFDELSTVLAMIDGDDGDGQEVEDYEPPEVMFQQRSTNVLYFQ